MSIFTQDQWLIVALVFVLGILVGAFMTAGGRKKWKTRYYDEQKRLKAREAEYNEREKHWAGQEKEWRERDSLRDAAVRDRRDPGDRPPL
jgi:uncharacterized membrane-anchored protein YhcB (DUF1043 family)